MNGAKILVVLVGCLVIAGVIYVQLPNRRPVSPPITGVPGQPAARPVEQLASGGTESPKASGVTSMPPAGWGRNPFLTPDEISKRSEPVEIPVEPAPSETRSEPASPDYQVHAIVSSDLGMWAVIDTRVIRAGDRLGRETVKEIKPEAVVLERDGVTRELPLKRLETDFRRTARKGAGVRAPTNGLNATRNGPVAAATRRKGGGNR